jgi:periplasmic protein TonB
MLGVLLESRAKRQRRAGGAALSVAAHLAIIGAAVVGTTRSVIARPAPPKVVAVTFAQPVAPTPVHRGAFTDNVIAPLPRNMIIERVAVPTFTPTSLPPIDMSGAIAADSIVLGGTPGVARGGGGSSSILTPDGDDREWTGNEVLMHIVNSVKPHYPESLRNASIDGRVLVQFIVDTLGGVDSKSIVVLQSTHDLFSRAAKDALVQFRFKPAQVGGRKIPALAEMPFEFRITK